MMAVNRVASFIETLRGLQMLEPACLDEVGRLPQARGDDPMALAREMIQRGWLTPYQVNCLAKGTGKDLVIGPYRLLDRLGEGGMGTVFKAMHMTMGRVVALKVIKKEKLSNPLAVKRFHQEVQTAAKLVHPNIVLAFDAGQVGETHYFAMEYIEGVDLAKLVKMTGPLPVLEACDYIRQAATGLQHAHERGLVHRDIKPNNLIVSRTMPGSGATNGSVSSQSLASRAVVKILDLGLARLQDDNNALTKIGAVVGTPEFLAPEQAKDSRGVDIRADLYSLGCTLYYLLAGKVPFRGNNVSETLIKHQKDDPPSLESRPDIPPHLWLVVKKLLAKKPEDRYQTPADLITALAPFNRRAAPAPASSAKLPAAALASTAEKKISPSDADLFANIHQSAGTPSRWAMKRRRQKRMRLAIASVLLAGLVGAGLGFRPEIQKFAAGLSNKPRSSEVAQGKSAPPPAAPTLPETAPAIEDPKTDPKTDPTQDTKVTDPKPGPKPDPKPDPKPEPAKRLAVPEPARQTEAERIIKDNFKAEYARKKPAELAEFAGKLLQEGMDTGDNPIARYVLFREARDLAIQAGDLEIALRAVDQLNKFYAVQGMELKLEVLEKANRAGASAATLRSILDSALAMAEDFAEGDEYDNAVRALAAARGAAVRMGNNSLANQISLKSREMAEIGKEYLIARLAAETLVKSPDEPDANFKWGRFLALYKGAWPKGLPLLAQGSDAKLKSLAEKEGKATETALMLELANAYLDLADSERASVPKRQLLLRAKEWFEKALPDLMGLNKSTVERRLKTIDTSLARDQIVLTDKTTSGTTGGDSSSTTSAYNKAMQTGLTAYQQGKFKDAIDAYTQALTIKPDDSRAQQALKRSRYALHMANGQQAMSQKEFRLAAQEFNKALEEIPGDVTAQASLAQARRRMGFGKFSN